MTKLERRAGALAGLLLLAAAPARAELLAIRVGKAETIANGTIEHAVILVENGKIVQIGEDLPIERGIRVVDRPDLVVTPGLVDCFSRLGLDSHAGNQFEPQAKASDELWAGGDPWREALKFGVTTIGLYPPGGGVPGQATAIQPYGDTAEDMILSDGCYLTIFMQTSSQSKKQLADAFEKVDKYEEKVAKDKEKWEKALEKQKKDDKKKKDDKETEKDDEERVPEVFVPADPDPKVAPFLALRNKTLKALFSIEKASDYLHTLDALGKEDIDFFVRAPLRDDIDLFEIAKQLGERKLTVVLEPEITLQPNSRRERNIPAELATAGAKIAFTPSASRRGGEDLEHWMVDVGRMVAYGMDRQAALAAVTLEPARVLGLDGRLGSLEKDKDANMVFWTGDPLEPTSRVQAVMIGGELVHGEVQR